MAGKITGDLIENGSGSGPDHDEEISKTKVQAKEQRRRKITRKVE